MDEIIDRLYQIELDADKSLDSLNEKKIQLKKQYDDSRKEYQQEAENKFAQQTAELKEHYDKEKNDQLRDIGDEYDENLKKIHKIFDHEQENYVEVFMNAVKKLGVLEDE